MGFTQLQEEILNCPRQSLAVAWAADPPVLEACVDAFTGGFLSEVVLTGVEQEIREVAAKNQIDISQFKIVEANTPVEAADLAVNLVRQGRCTILMKGLLNTSVLLKSVLNKETGIRKAQLLSHIGIIEFPGEHLVLLTDGGMNIRPNLEEKIQIVDNSIEFAYSLGIDLPKVALLAAIEGVNPKMPETIDAAAITQMGNRKQFGKAAVIDGPLAFDNVVSLEAAKHKGLTSPVSGCVDILIVPEIVSGNILYKSFTFMAHLSGAGLVYGARCPIVLTSRSDSRESKLNSIVVACKAAANR